MAAKSNRWLEGLKSLLILLLTASAFFLLWKSPLVQDSGLSSLLEGSLSGEGEQSDPISALTAVAPSRMAARSERGLYGVQYDQSATDALFEQTAPLLGEALSGALAPSPLSDEGWQRLLSGSCLYFDFTSSVPLASLCTWLGGEDCPLTGSARCLLLAPGEDGAITLCWRESGGACYQTTTGLDSALHLSPILDGISPNSAYFAFEDSTLPAVLSPYTLFTGEELSPDVYVCTTPALLSGGSQTAQLLAALSFSDRNRAAVSEGTLYVDGEDALRLYGSGMVEYTSDSLRYPAGEGLSGAVDAAWALAEGAIAPLCGDARLYLLSAEEEGQGYTVTFGYMLDGCAVELSDCGRAARFYITDGRVSEFTLYLRTFTPTGQSQLLLPADRAAAALTALTDSPKELVIRYRTVGDDLVPGWTGL